MIYERFHLENSGQIQNSTTPEISSGELLARWIGPVACYGAAGLSAAIAYNSYTEGDVATGVVGGITAAMFAIVGTGWRKIENQPLS